jgi:hypothetical protein
MTAQLPRDSFGSKRLDIAAGVIGRSPARHFNAYVPYNSTEPCAGYICEISIAPFF